MTPNRFYIDQAAQFDGQQVTVRGWVYNKRSSGKIKFLMMRDGTGLMQAIFFKGECEDASFEEFEKLTQESAFEVTGVLRKDPRTPGKYEMGAQKLKIISIAEP